MPTGTPTVTPPADAGAPAVAIGVLVSGNFIAGAPDPVTTRKFRAAPAPTPTPISGIVALVPNGGWGTRPDGNFLETSTGLQIVPIAPNPSGGFEYATVHTPNVVNSCSVDQTTRKAVCTANNTDIYIINDVANPGDSPDATLTSAGTGTVTFSGGKCTTCGVVVDSVTHKAVISISMAEHTSGYQLLDLTNNQLSTPIPATGAEIGESFAVDTARNFILSPSEAASGQLPNYQIFNISNPASPTLFNFAAAADKFPDSTDLDSALVDSTGIALGTLESTTKMFLADLSQVSFNSGAGTWTAPNQVQDLGSAFSSFTNGLTAMALATGTHQALLIDESGTSAFAAIQLPSNTGTLAVQDWAVASMPKDPTQTVWTMPHEPHGLTAVFADLNGTNKGIGLVMNAPVAFGFESPPRTYIAVVDLGALLAAPRGTDGHTVDPDFDLVKNGVVTFIPVMIAF